ETRIALFKQACEQIKSLPGVRAVGTAYSLPMSSVALAWGPIAVEGYVPENSVDSIIANQRFVSPGYFPALEVPLVKGRFFDDRLYDSLAQRRFAMSLLGVFAILALILAAIGVYGVMVYSVNQRTHEFGVRMALGADRGHIIHIVLGHGLLLITLGISGGIAV